MKKTTKKQVLIPLTAIFFLAMGSSFKSDFFEIAKQIEIFTTLFKELNMNYVDETNPAALMDSAVKNMLGELDPYTRFMNEQDVEAQKMNNVGEYSGIGALVRSYESKLVIIEPYKGYPADRAGLKAGDEILKIGGTKVADFDDNAGELLKGTNGTRVEVTFVRQGQTRTTALERQGVEVDAVPYYNMIDGATGYIVLARFNRKASGQTRSAIQDLRGRGMERLVLDLRGNPGGLLSEAINVTNLFVPKGELIVTTKSKVKKFNQEYRTKKGPEALELPLVVLIDGKSASASEIVSGSLQDLDRAVVVGARSFGKGLVQRPLKLTYGTQLKVTISRYHTPSGRCIQALDYWNRDEKGNAVRNTKFRAFATRNGRKVQDGGGVTPDVEIAALRSNAFLTELKESNVIFDYATKFHFGHSFPSVNDFEFTAADFEAFKHFARERGLAFRTKTEELLREAMEKDEDLLGKDVGERYEDLLLAVNKGKITALDTYEKEIRKSLEDEIIKRFFYREGLYKHHLRHDEAILAATALLADADTHQKLLR